MTYAEWIEDHNNKVSEILSRIDFKSNEELIDYFEYDNMKDKEKDFCPLYGMKKKCHDIDNLNCYYCACPYFAINPTPRTTGKTTIGSICTINSKHKGTFLENPDENNVVKVHCDCTNCFIPHKASFAKKFLNNVTKVKVSETESLLDYIRTK